MRFFLLIHSQNIPCVFVHQLVDIIEIYLFIIVNVKLGKLLRGIIGIKNPACDIWFLYAAQILNQYFCSIVNINYTVSIIIVIGIIIWFKFFT